MALEQSGHNLVTYLSKYGALISLSHSGKKMPAEAAVLAHSAVMIVYFTCLAEFARVFLGLPMAWGGAALDAVMATLVVGAAFWLQENATSADTVSTPASSECELAPTPIPERLIPARSNLDLI